MNTLYRQCDTSNKWKIVRILFTAQLCVLSLTACHPFAGLTMVVTSGAVAQGVAEGLSAIHSPGVENRICYCLSQTDEADLSAFPYYIEADTEIEDFNADMIAAGAEITLARTYQTAYGLDMKTVKPDGDSRRIFYDSKLATYYLQRILKDYGEPNAENYLITDISTACKHGLRLYAVVYRPRQTVSVIDKYNKESVRTLSPSDIRFYDSYFEDCEGNRLDRIIEWGVMPVNFPMKQKYQAIMLTLGANAVVEHRNRAGYWIAEQQWLNGDFLAVAQSEDSKRCEAIVFWNPNTDDRFN